MNVGENINPLNVQGPTMDKVQSTDSEAVDKANLPADTKKEITASQEGKKLEAAILTGSTSVGGATQTEEQVQETPLERAGQVLSGAAERRARSQQEPERNRSPVVEGDRYGLTSP